MFFGRLTRYDMKVTAFAKVLYDFFHFFNRLGRYCALFILQEKREPIWANNNGFSSERYTFLTIIDKCVFRPSLQYVIGLNILPH